MKVLVVSSMYPTKANPVGGIFVHEQVQALRRAGIDARVVSGKPLWLSGRRPRLTIRSVRAELRARKKPFAWADYDGVPVANFNYFAGALSRPWIYPWIYRESLKAFIQNLAQDFPYDIVHTHTAFLDGHAGAAAADLRSVPMVLTEHTGPFKTVTEDWRMRWQTLSAMKRADLIIAVSRALRAEITRCLPAIGADRVVVVPNGVDTKFFDPGFAGDARGRWGAIIQAAKREIRLPNFIVGLREGFREIGDQQVTGEYLARVVETATRAGLGEGPYRKALVDAGLFVVPDPALDDKSMADANAPPRVHALWVGHLVEVKRVDRLLDAFSIALVRRPSLRLRLVGGGDLEAALRQRARDLGLDDAVTFVPSLSRDGIRREMAFADFLVISSDTETFGVVGIEALAMSVPVLTTECGGPADFVTSPAYGERVGKTAEDLAIGLQQMAYPAGGLDREAIRRHAIENFDFSHVADRLAKLYAGLLDLSDSKSTT